MYVEFYILKIAVDAIASDWVVKEGALHINWR